MRPYLRASGPSIMPGAEDRSFVPLAIPLAVMTRWHRRRQAGEQHDDDMSDLQ